MVPVVDYSYPVGGSPSIQLFFQPYFTHEKEGGCLNTSLTARRGALELAEAEIGLVVRQVVPASEMYF